MFGWGQRKDFEIGQLVFDQTPCFTPLGFEKLLCIDSVGDMWMIDGGGKATRVVEREEV